MSDSLNSFLFSTPAMSSVFSGDAQLRAMMRFEWALTRAIEKHGLAAAGSGAALEELLDTGFVDRQCLEREAKDAGNVAIPFLRQLTAAVKARNETASRAIHLGATSQDVLDTALVLQVREALVLLDESMSRLDTALVKQVRAHADTVLAGRTWLQPGPPTTLGLKLAGTLAALRRDRDRIRSACHGRHILRSSRAVRSA
jgi:3-carboxy-cis,cis-muconate cycloisomerase